MIILFRLFIVIIKRALKYPAVVGTMFLQSCLYIKFIHSFNRYLLSTKHVPRHLLHIEDSGNKFFKILYSHLSFVYKDNPETLNSFHLYITINFSIAILFSSLITLPFIQMSSIRRCLELRSRGRCDFCFGCLPFIIWALPYFI